MLEPARERDVLRGVRVDGAAEKRLGRGDREREVAARRDDDLAALDERPSHSGSAENHCRPRPDDGELLGGDRLPRVAEHVHVVERDVREHDDARVEDVRRVVAAA